MISFFYDIMRSCAHRSRIDYSSHKYHLQLQLSYIFILVALSIIHALLNSVASVAFVVIKIPHHTSIFNDDDDIPQKYLYIRIDWDISNIM